jgi:hypothetical protein
MAEETALEEHAKPSRAEQRQKRHRRPLKLKPLKNIPPLKESPAKQCKKMQSRIEANKGIKDRYRAPPFVEEVQPSKEVEEIEKSCSLV